MKKSFLSIIVLVICPILLMAQPQLKRQVISSFGGSARIDTQVYVSYTGGQPPMSGTIHNSEYIRQGFEQPKSINVCGILNNFVVEEVGTECGNYYSFEYTGTTDTDLEFEWDFGALAIPRYSSEQNVFDVVYTVEGSYTISLVVTNSEGCKTEASKYVFATNNPLGAMLNADALDCDSDSYDISIVPHNGEEPITIEWADGMMGFDREDLAIGTYAYTVSDASNCSYVDSFIVDFSNPELNLTAELTTVNCDTSVLGGIELTIQGGVPPLNAEWTDGFTGVNRTNLFPGIYNVEVFDSRGCSKTEAFEIVAVCITENNLPNTFTPNGDDTNDSWEVPHIEDYPNNTLAIYNRWGSIIYESAPYHNEWTGTNTDNEELPMGAYYYVLELNDSDNTRISGSITILR